MLQILAPNEAVVSVGIEIRIGEISGMMNLGIPSIIIKMLRQKFDQQWSVRKSESTEEERARMLKLMKPAWLKIDSRLQGPTLSVQQMLGLDIDDVLTFDYPVNKPLDLVVNGTLKYHGQLCSDGRKRLFAIDEFHTVE